MKNVALMVCVLVCLVFINCDDTASTVEEPTYAKTTDQCSTPSDLVSPTIVQWRITSGGDIYGPGVNVTNGVYFPYNFQNVWFQFSKPYNVSRSIISIYKINSNSIVPVSIVGQNNYGEYMQITCQFQTNTSYIITGVVFDMAGNETILETVQVNAQAL